MSRIIIRGIAYPNIANLPSLKEVHALKEWMKGLPPHDVANFRTLAADPALGGKLISRMSQEGEQGVYCKMLAIAIKVLEFK